MIFRSGFLKKQIKRPSLEGVSLLVVFLYFYVAYLYIYQTNKHELCIYCTAEVLMSCLPSASSLGSSSRSCPAARFAPWRTRTAPWTAWGTRPARRPVCPAKQPPRPSPSPPATVNVTSDGHIDGAEGLQEDASERQSNKTSHSACVELKTTTTTTHKLIFDGCQNTSGC